MAGIAITEITPASAWVKAFRGRQMGRWPITMADGATRILAAGGTA
ncbi:MAG: hypothetical protein JO081_07350 [Alphaproteobacteria bacterium]|nr:hypothetical protein [Alphaproteobacteria bacterium]